MAHSPTTRPSLLIRLRDHRDRSAWVEFVELYAPVVFGFARRHGLQHSDAADITQDVFRNVAGAISRFDYTPARGGFRAWLFQVTRNALGSFRRSTSRVTAGGGVALDELPDPAEHPDAVWEDEWRREVFARACDDAREAVSPATWEAFYRTAVLGHAGRDVAADLRMSAAAVYLAKGRVLARMRQFVEAIEQE